MKRQYFKIRQLMVSTVASVPFGVGDFIMRSEFSRNVIKLSSGSILVTALGLFVTPINTRLFSPEDYGLMNLMTATAGLFGVLLSFNINPVILMEKRQRLAEATATLSFILLGTSLLLVAGLLFGLGDYLLPLIHAEQLKPWLPLLFIAMGLGGVGAIAVQLIQRKKMYGLFSKSTVITNLAGHCIRIPWGYFSPSFYVLYLSNFIAGILGLLIVIPHAMYRWRTSLRRLRFVFLRNLKFMSFQTSANILGIVAVQLPIYWIAAKCSVEDVGYFGMTMLLIDVPMTLLSSSIVAVFFKRVADTIANEPRKIFSLFWRTTGKLALLGLIPLIAVGCVAPFLPFILSEQWAPVVSCIYWVMIWKYMCFVFPLGGQIMIVLRKNFFFVWGSALSIVMIFCALSLADNKLSSILFALNIAWAIRILIGQVEVLRVLKNFKKTL